ncbi:MAG: hypothetical protein OEV42_10105 [Deltaproteobacteria bacterium]|nr:hypothetical protein [Deltaproteobacteria bacterium]
MITSETTISSGNGYPLSEKEMKSAVIDRALSEFTENGQFKIIEDKEGKLSQLDGGLKFNIALIGTAEVVKLTVTLQMKNGVTYVSTVSVDLHGMDYQGIYDAFEHVGTEAAKRLNTKIAMLNGDNRQREQKSPKPNSEILSIFNEAQQLKRKEQYRESRVLFEIVVKESSKAEQQWHNMATDELRYGLPLFEADNLLYKNNMGDPLSIRDKMKQVSHLYRQILADNSNNPTRVLEINRRLDQLSISLTALATVVKASSLSRATPIRFKLIKHYSMTGEWPDEITLKKVLADELAGFDLI